MARGKHFAKKDQKTNLEFFKIWAAVFTVVSVVFLGMLVYMNMLTITLLIAASVVVILFNVGLGFVLIRKSDGKGAKIAATVISILLTIGYVFGIYYIGNTMAFLGNITNSKEQITEYHVIVKENSAYNKIKDIKGHTVLTLSGSSSDYNQAKEELKDKVKVEFGSSSNINDLFESVMNQNNIAFVTAGNYENTKEVIEGLEDNTRILYTVKVKSEQKDIVKKTDVTKNPFNVYVTGIDTDGPISTVSRSDVNMILTIDPASHHVIMTSIPRDSYVPLQGDDHQGQMDKFTHTGIYGVEETIATAEAMLGIDINYYVKVNFTTVRELIDILGGVDINSEQEFSAGGYYFNVGMNHVSGDAALAFARERYSFSNGDFQRNRNQQIVVEGVINKITSSTAILTSYTDILSTIQNYMATNMSAKDIQRLVKMQLGNMTGWTTESMAVTGTTGSSPCYSLGNMYASVVYPDDNSIAEIREKISLYK